MKLIAFFLCLIAFSGLSCSSNDVDIVEFKATIREGSSLQLSCDYIIQPDFGGYVVPTFLPTDYRQDGIQVYIKAEMLNQTSECGNLIGDGKLIRIEQISPN